VSRDLGTRTCFFQAFESGGAILPFLSSVGRRRDDGATVRQLAGELTAVVATELAGRAPLHLIAWEAGPHAVRPASPAGSADVVRSAVLRAGSSYQLTASMLALAVRELLAGRVPAGLRHADVLAPELVSELPGLDGGTRLETRPGPLAAWAADAAAARAGPVDLGGCGR